jgi:hypothetical protein
LRTAAGYSALQCTSRSARQGSTRGTCVIIGTLGLLLAAARTSTAQRPAEPTRAWEFRVPAGGLVPTGAQRNAVEDAHLSAAQLSYAVRPTFAITGTVGWARSRDLASANDPRLDVFTYDLGAEARAPEWFAGRAVTFSPFVGAGVGARSYNHRTLDVDATHTVAGYGAVGGALGRGRIGLRLEARDYVSGFRPLVGDGSARMRNDLVALLSLSVKRGSR